MINLEEDGISKSISSHYDEFHFDSVKEISKNFRPSELPFSSTFDGCHLENLPCPLSQEENGGLGSLKPGRSLKMEWEESKMETKPVNFSGSSLISQAPEVLSDIKGKKNISNALVKKSSNSKLGIFITNLDGDIRTQF